MDIWAWFTNFVLLLVILVGYERWSNIKIDLDLARARAKCGDAYEKGYKELDRLFDEMAEAYDRTHNRLGNLIAAALRAGRDNSNRLSEGEGRNAQDREFVRAFAEARQAWAERWHPNVLPAIDSAVPTPAAIDRDGSLTALNPEKREEIRRYARVILSKIQQGSIEHIQALSAPLHVMVSEVCQSIGTPTEIGNQDLDECVLDYVSELRTYADKLEATARDLEGPGSEAAKKSPTPPEAIGHE